jgi:hypothetical protein
MDSLNCIQTLILPFDHNLSNTAYIMYTGIGFALHPYIPQHSPQIWDETPKTRIDFSILRNTRLRVVDFSLINDHATLLCFSSSRGVFLNAIRHFNSVDPFNSTRARSPARWSTPRLSPMPVQTRYLQVERVLSSIQP